MHVIPHLKALYKLHLLICRKHGLHAQIARKTALKRCNQEEVPAQFGVQVRFPRNFTQETDCA